MKGAHTYTVESRRSRRETDTTLMRGACLWKRTQCDISTTRNLRPRPFEQPGERYRFISLYNPIYPTPPLYPKVQPTQLHLSPPSSSLEHLLLPTMSKSLLSAARSCRTDPYIQRAINLIFQPRLRGTAKGRMRVHELATRRHFLDLAQ